MAEQLTSSLVNSLSPLLSLPFGKQAIIFIISMMPVLESRGGLIAAAILNLDMLQSVIIAFIGNIIPLMLILLAFDKMYAYMRRSKISFLNKIANNVDKKVEQHRAGIEKYGFWGLAIFVGIPFPGTGAWTGCIIASVLRMDRKTSLLSATLGVLIATALMTLFSFGLLAKLLH